MVSVNTSPTPAIVSPVYTRGNVRFGIIIYYYAKNAANCKKEKGWCYAPKIRGSISRNCCPQNPPSTCQPLIQTKITLTLALTTYISQLKTGTNPYF